MKWKSKNRKLSVLGLWEGKNNLHLLRPIKFLYISVKRSIWYGPFFLKFLFRKIFIANNITMNTMKEVLGCPCVVFYRYWTTIACQFNIMIAIGLSCESKHMWTRIDMLLGRKGDG
jgi:hypothetical protein